MNTLSRFCKSVLEDRHRTLFSCPLKEFSQTDTELSKRSHRQADRQIDRQNSQSVLTGRHITLKVFSQTDTALSKRSHRHRTLKALILTDRQTDNSLFPSESVFTNSHTTLFLCPVNRETTDRQPSFCALLKCSDRQTDRQTGRQPYF
jgi:hypothetical protein